MKTIDERLVEIFRSVFPDLSATEVPAATQKSVSQWDSVATVTLAAAVQEEFGVDLEPEEVESFVSFQDMKALLETKLPPTGQTQG